MQAYLGEIAALATAVCWAATSLFFTIAGKQVGSQFVNRVRLPLAASFLAITHLLWQGEVLPIHAEPSRWGWLGLSAIIGLVVGDSLLFQAFVLIGTRLSMLLMTLAPVSGTLLAWVFLGERLSLLEIGAIIVTVSSVAWVVSERDNSGPVDGNPRSYATGVLCGIGGASGQALGLILSKRGMAGDFPALSASLMRLLVATMVIWLWALIQGQLRPAPRSPQLWGGRGERIRRARWAIVGGTVAGPFIGMTLSLSAVQLTHVGIASTLMSLSPVILLPLAHWLFKERITQRAIVGTAVAMVGVAVIFWT
ncbi:MAG: DMT family transporter [Anaerolineae bacterium]